jgi:hypothetical protein
MSEERLVPVHPARDEKGRLKSLLPFIRKNPDEALPYPHTLDELDISERKMLVHFFQTSASVASKLGLMSAVSSSRNSLQEAAVFEILVGSHKIRTGNVTGLLVRETFWGSSIRIAMRVKARESSATGGFSVLAASVELGTAQVEYEISSLGAITPLMLATALEGMPLFGTLSFAAYTQFNEAAQKIALTLMAEATLPPVPVAVKLDYHPPASSMVEALATRYAMIALAHLKPLEAALHDAPREIDQLVIRSTYRRILDGAAAPLEIHAEKARSWLNA